MSRSVEDVKNWMNCFRWIVKLIRDDYGIDEGKLIRTAVLESDLGLSIEQIEEIMEIISQSFRIRFPDGALDELVKLEELCLLTSWLAGFHKRPEFISADFESRCRGLNAIAA